jgi:hypothetical protein
LVRCRNHLGASSAVQKDLSSGVSAGILLAPTSFFLLTNFAAWAAMPQLYPRSLAGIGLSYTAGLPFYRNDLLSTTIVAGLAFGLPAVAHLLAQRHQPASI